MRTPIWKIIPAVLLLPWILMALHAKEGLLGLGVDEAIKFSLPERDRQGRLLWQLTGSHAKKLNADTAEFDEMLLALYRQDNVTWTFSTPKCLFHEENQKRELLGELPVRIFNKKMEITGIGFQWLIDEDRFIVRNKVKVILWEGISK